MSAAGIPVAKDLSGPVRCCSKELRVGGVMAADLMRTRFRTTPGQNGFSLVQLLIVVAVIAIVSTMAVYGIAEARQRIRLTNSSRLLASYLEKTRVDSVRRHAVVAAQMSGITFLNSQTYRVTMDFDGDGTMETRDVTLDDGVVIVTSPLPAPVLFDWRGRLLGAVDRRESITLQYGTDEDDQRSVDITKSGDVTIDSDVYIDDIPNVNVNVNSLTGVDSGSTINGNNTATPTPTPVPSPETDPTPEPTPEATPTPTPGTDPIPTPTPPVGEPTPTPTPLPSPVATPTPTPMPCLVTVTPSALSISKSGGTGTVTFAVTIGGSVSFASGPSNLKVTQNSTNYFTVTSLNNSRGDFTLVFDTPCGTTNVVVTVNN